MGGLEVAATHMRPPARMREKFQIKKSRYLGLWQEVLSIISVFWLLNFDL